MKQSYPSDEEISRTQNINKKFNVKNGQELTMLYLKLDVLQLANVFEKFVEKSTLMYNINFCVVTLYLVIHGKLKST